MQMPWIRQVQLVAAGLLIATSAAHAATPGSGQARIEAAAVQDKYAFLMFYRHQDNATRIMEQTIRSELSRRNRTATLVKVRITDPAESTLVRRFDATRSPMPTVMALAPNGAVTGVYALKVNSAQVNSAILTPKYCEMVKALQEQKVVLLCLQPSDGGFVPKGVTDFEADPHFNGRTYRLVVKAHDPGEQRLFERMKVRTDIKSPVVLIFAPPGAFLGRFDAGVTSRQLSSTIHKSGKCNCEKCRRHRK